MAYNMRGEVVLAQQANPTNPQELLTNEQIWQQIIKNDFSEVGQIGSPRFLNSFFYFMAQEFQRLNSQHEALNNVEQHNTLQIFFSQVTTLIKELIKAGYSNKHLWLFFIDGYKGAINFDFLQQLWSAIAISEEELTLSEVYHLAITSNDLARFCVQNKKLKRILSEDPAVLVKLTELWPDDFLLATHALSPLEVKSKKLVDVPFQATMVADLVDNPRKQKEYEKVISRRYALLADRDAISNSMIRLDEVNKAVLEKSKEDSQLQPIIIAIHKVYQNKCNLMPAEEDLALIARLFLDRTIVMIQARFTSSAEFTFEQALAEFNQMYSANNNPYAKYAKEKLEDILRNFVFNPLVVRADEFNILQNKLKEYDKKARHSLVLKEYLENCWSSQLVKLRVEILADAKKLGLVSDAEVFLSEQEYLILANLFNDENFYIALDEFVKKRNASFNRASLESELVARNTNVEYRQAVNKILSKLFIREGEHGSGTSKIKPENLEHIRQKAAEYRIAYEQHNHLIALLANTITAVDNNYQRNKKTKAVVKALKSTQKELSTRVNLLNKKLGECLVRFRRLAVNNPHITESESLDNYFMPRKSFIANDEDKLNTLACVRNIITLAEAAKAKEYLPHISVSHIIGMLSAIYLENSIVNDHHQILVANEVLINNFLQALLSNERTKSILIQLFKDFARNPVPEENAVAGHNKNARILFERYILNNCVLSVNMLAKQPDLCAAIFTKYPNQLVDLLNRDHDFLTNGKSSKESYKLLHKLLGNICNTLTGEHLFLLIQAKNWAKFDWSNYLTARPKADDGTYPAERLRAYIVGVINSEEFTHNKKMKEHILEFIKNNPKIIQKIGLDKIPGLMLAWIKKTNANIDVCETIIAAPELWENCRLSQREPEIKDMFPDFLGAGAFMLRAAEELSRKLDGRGWFNRLFRGDASYIAKAVTDNFEDLSADKKLFYNKTNDESNAHFRQDYALVVAIAFLNNPNFKNVYRGKDAAFRSISPFFAMVLNEGESASILKLLQENPQAFAREIMQDEQGTLLQYLWCKIGVKGIAEILAAFGKLDEFYYSAAKKVGSFLTEQFMSLEAETKNEFGSKCLEFAKSNLKVFNFIFSETNKNKLATELSSINTKLASDLISITAGNHVETTSTNREVPSNVVKESKPKTTVVVTETEKKESEYYEQFMAESLKGQTLSSTEQLVVLNKFSIQYKIKLLANEKFYNINKDFIGKIQENLLSIIEKNELSSAKLFDLMIGKNEYNEDTLNRVISPQTAAAFIRLEDSINHSRFKDFLIAKTIEFFKSLTDPTLREVLCRAILKHTNLPGIIKLAQADSSVKAQAVELLIREIADGKYPVSSEIFNEIPQDYLQSAISKNVIVAMRCLKGSVLITEAIQKIIANWNTIPNQNTIINLILDKALLTDVLTLIELIKVEDLSLDALVNRLFVKKELAQYFQVCKSPKQIKAAIQVCKIISKDKNLREQAKNIKISAALLKQWFVEISDEIDSYSSESVIFALSCCDVDDKNNFSIITAELDQEKYVPLLKRIINQIEFEQLSKPVKEKLLQIYADHNSNVIDWLATLAIHRESALIIDIITNKAENSADFLAGLIRANKKIAFDLVTEKNIDSLALLLEKFPMKELLDFALEMAISSTLNQKLIELAISYRCETDKSAIKEWLAYCRQNTDAMQPFFMKASHDFIIAIFGRSGKGLYQAQDFITLYQLPNSEIKQVIAGLAKNNNHIAAAILTLPLPYTEFLLFLPAVAAVLKNKEQRSNLHHRNLVWLLIEEDLFQLMVTVYPLSLIDAINVASDDLLQEAKVQAHLTAVFTDQVLVNILLKKGLGFIAINKLMTIPLIKSALISQPEVCRLLSRNNFDFGHGDFALLYAIEKDSSLLSDPRIYQAASNFVQEILASTKVAALSIDQLAFVRKLLINEATSRIFVDLSEEHVSNLIKTAADKTVNPLVAKTLVHTASNQTKLAEAFKAYIIKISKDLLISAEYLQLLKALVIKQSSLLSSITFNEQQWLSLLSMFETTENPDFELFNSLFGQFAWNAENRNIFLAACRVVEGADKTNWATRIFVANSKFAAILFEHVEFIDLVHATIANFYGKEDFQRIVPDVIQSYRDAWIKLFAQNKDIEQQIQQTLALAKFAKLANLLVTFADVFGIAEILKNPAKQRELFTNRDILLCLLTKPALIKQIVISDEPAIRLAQLEQLFFEGITTQQVCSIFNNLAPEQSQKIFTDDTTQAFLLEKPVFVKAFANEQVSISFSFSENKSLLVKQAKAVFSEHTTELSKRIAQDPGRFKLENLLTDINLTKELMAKNAALAFFVWSSKERCQKMQLTAFDFIEFLLNHSIDFIKDMLAVNWSKANDIFDRYRESLENPANVNNIKDVLHKLGVKLPVKSTEPTIKRSTYARAKEKATQHKNKIEPKRAIDTYNQTFKTTRDQAEASSYLLDNDLAKLADEHKINIVEILLRQVLAENDIAGLVELLKVPAPAKPTISIGKSIYENYKAMIIRQVTEWLSSKDFLFDLLASKEAFKLLLSELPVKGMNDKDQKFPFRNLVQQKLNAVLPITKETRLSTDQIRVFTDANAWLNIAEHIKTDSKKLALIVDCLLAQDNPENIKLLLTQYWYGLVALVNDSNKIRAWVRKVVTAIPELAVSLQPLHFTYLDANFVKDFVYADSSLTKELTQGARAKAQLILHRLDLLELDLDLCCQLTMAAGYADNVEDAKVFLKNAKFISAKIQDQIELPKPAPKIATLAIAPIETAGNSTPITNFSADDRTDAKTETIVITATVTPSVPVTDDHSSSPVTAALPAVVNIKAPPPPPPPKMNSSANGGLKIIKKNKTQDAATGNASTAIKTKSAPAAAAIMSTESIANFFAKANAKKAANPSIVQSETISTTLPKKEIKPKDFREEMKERFQKNLAKQNEKLSSQHVSAAGSTNAAQSAVPPAPPPRGLVSKIAPTTLPATATLAPPPPVPPRADLPAEVLANKPISNSRDALLQQITLGEKRLKKISEQVADKKSCEYINKLGEALAKADDESICLLAKSTSTLPKVQQANQTDLILFKDKLLSMSLALQESFNERITKALANVTTAKKDDLLKNYHENIAKWMKENLLKDAEKDFTDIGWLYYKFLVQETLEKANQSPISITTFMGTMRSKFSAMWNQYQDEMAELEKNQQEDNDWDDDILKAPQLKKQ